jgi:hypothetical protein
LLCPGCSGGHAVCGDRASALSALELFAQCKALDFSGGGQR